MPMRKFAQDTSVPVSRSQEALKDQLRSLEVRNFRFSEAHDMFGIEFLHAETGYRITVHPPENCDDKELRRLWRVLLLVFKAKIESVRSGVSTFEQEFLAHVITEGGLTVFERLQPSLEQSKGKLLLLPMLEAV